MFWKGDIYIEKEVFYWGGVEIFSDRVLLVGEEITYLDGSTCK
jgi:hypothetical protein